MKESGKHNEILYAITKEDVQLEAKRFLGRELSEDEILQAKDCIEWGIGESIDDIYSTIFNEVIEK
jgi:hypothetical protein